MDDIITELFELKENQREVQLYMELPHDGTMNKMRRWLVVVFS
jgi:hypothetical protein